MVLTFLLVNVYSQHKILLDDFPIFEGVINKENIRKAELFDLLREWTVVSFKSAKDVIQFEDKSIGKIMSKGNSRYTIDNGTTIINETVYFILTLDTKDDRFKYKLEFTNINSSGIDAPIASALLLDLESINNLKFVGKKFKNKAIEAQKSTVSQREENFNEISANIISSLLDITKDKNNDNW
jgi:hypothetical protein